MGGINPQPPAICTGDSLPLASNPTPHILSSTTMTFQGPSKRIFVGKEWNQKTENLEFGRGINSEMVDLYVGPYNERLHVHKYLLCENVSYFQRMFNGSADEAKVQAVNFPEDDPEAFDLVLRWIYRDTIEPILSVSNFIRKSPFWKSITFYILAEKLCLPKLQDHIMSNAFAHYRNKDLLPSIHMMDCAYSGTSPKSPLRKFIVRGFHWALCRKDYYNVVYDNVDHENGVWSIDNLQSLLVAHPDLQKDFLALLREDITPRHLDEFTPCDFHCHSKDEPCHLC